MAQMYFYKFNINSDIYDVYAQPELKNKILEEVFESINTNLVCSYEYKDNDGNEKIAQYKFCDLEKDANTLTISGRLVKIFDGEIETYDRIRDTIDIQFQKDKAASATFCFDIYKEEIAFITRQGLGYLQFGKCFKNLLETRFPEDAFVFVLEKNVGELKEKIYNIPRILKMSATIIPPNPNEEDFAVLFGTNVEEFRETKATKYIQGIEVPTKGKNEINPKTRFFDRIFYGTAKGYAKMFVEGRNRENVPVTVDSDEDAPYKSPIPEIEKDSIIAFKERAGAEIVKLLKDKSQIKVKEYGEINEEKET